MLRVSDFTNSLIITDSVKTVLYDKRTGRTIIEENNVKETIDVPAGLSVEELTELFFNK